MTALRLGELSLDCPAVMGILNTTPDSFSDGGRFTDLSVALEHAERMAEEGAAIVDIGGESTRPVAEPVSVEARIIERNLNEVPVVVIPAVSSAP